MTAGCHLPDVPVAQNPHVHTLLFFANYFPVIMSDIIFHRRIADTAVSIHPFGEAVLSTPGTDSIKSMFNLLDVRIYFAT